MAAWLPALCFVSLAAMTVCLSTSSECVCGERGAVGTLDLKITGGQEAGVNEFPWAALLEIKEGGRSRRCGRYLINDR